MRCAVMTRGMLEVSDVYEKTETCLTVRDKEAEGDLGVLVVENDEAKRDH